MDESKPETCQRPEQSSDSVANQNEKGHFELIDLLRAHRRHLDEQRPVVPLRRVKNGQE
jgi:hypothetical protein